MSPDEVRRGSRCRGVEMGKMGKMRERIYKGQMIKDE